MKIQRGVNPESRMIQITVTTPLLAEYYNNFSGMIRNNSSSISEGVNVERVNTDSAMVSFPLPSDSQMINHGDKALVSMPPEVVDKLNDVINKFVNCGLRKTLKTVEFLPLNNYELSGLQEDIKSAIENKRNFCILRDYKEYQKMSEERKYQFTQKLIKYGTSEYVDVALLINSGKMDELRRWLDPQLSYCEWI